MTSPPDIPGDPASGDDGGSGRDAGAAGRRPESRERDDDPASAPQPLHRPLQLRRSAPIFPGLLSPSNPWTSRSRRHIRWQGGDDTRRPVLVTGLPRSGTSWVGRMLVAGGELVYVNEPLNPEHPPGHSPGVLDATVTHRFQYICPDDEAPWLRAFRDTIALRYRFAAELRRNRSPYDLARMVKYGASFTAGRLRGRRALLDDPFALFSAGWFASRLGCNVIILIRDPVSLVASWRRLGWKADLTDLLDQPLLLRDQPHIEAVRPLADSADQIARIAALWNVAQATVSALAAAHPAIRVMRYEDLATDPPAGFRDLYEWAGLIWSERSEAAVRRATFPSGRAGRGGFSWTGLSRTAFRPMDPREALTGRPAGLTPAEIAYIRCLTMRH